MALEPNTDVVLGPLEARLGVSFRPMQLADEVKYVIKDRSLADRLNIITDQFSSHASVTGLSRSRAGSGILFLGAGSFDAAEFASDYGADKPKRTWVVKSLSSSFRDGNRNFSRDQAEVKQIHNLVAAIEGPKAPAAKEAKVDAPDHTHDGTGKHEHKEDTKPPRKLVESKRMRAFLMADAHGMSDGVLANVRLNQNLVLDALKWVGGEEKFSGQIESEKDKPLEHTKGGDVLRFYATILGAPLIVLGLGLASVRLRRRRRKKS